MYISTDYVFDGGVKSREFAPYQPAATPMPLNLYGETKRDGEVAVLGVAARTIVVRVPVLYGVVRRRSTSRPRSWWPTC